MSEYLKRLMSEISANLRSKALEWTKQHVHRTESLEEAKRLLEKRAGIVELPWCGKTECGLKLEEELNARVLGTSEDKKEKTQGKCVICNDAAQTLVRTAMTY